MFMVFEREICLILEYNIILPTIEKTVRKPCSVLHFENKDVMYLTLSESEVKGAAQ